MNLLLKAILLSMLSHWAMAEDGALNLLQAQEAADFNLSEGANVLSADLRGRSPRILLQSPLLIQDGQGQEVAETSTEVQLVAEFSDKDQVDMLCTRQNTKFKNSGKFYRI